MSWRCGAEGGDAEASLTEARLETRKGFQVRLKARPRTVEPKIRTPRRPLSQDEKDALRSAWIRCNLVLHTFVTHAFAMAE